VGGDAALGTAQALHPLRKLGKKDPLASVSPFLGKNNSVNAHFSQGTETFSSRRLHSTVKIKRRFSRKHPLDIP